MAVIAFLFVFVMAASALDIEVGPDIEVTFNKEIELDNLDMDADLAAEYYDVKATISVSDWLKVSPKVGINHMAITIGDVELNSGIGWNVGVDADAKVLTTDYADIHLVGGYQFSRTSIDEIDVAGITISNPVETIVYLHEFEVGAVVSKDLSEIDALKNFNIPVTPYIGIVYSDMIGNVDVNLGMFDLDEDIAAKRNVGLRCGLQAKPIKDLDLSVSIGAKFVDETAVMISGIIKF